MTEQLQLENDQKSKLPFAGYTHARYHESTIIKAFKAPRDLVYTVLTEPEHITQWWRPEGYKIIESSMDLQPGGLFHYCLESPTGEKIWGRFVYRETVSPEKLAFVISFSDENGGIKPHPASHNWPREILNTITLEEQNGTTVLTLKATPVNAAEKEIKTFMNDAELFQHELTGSFDQLKDYLASFFLLTIKFFNDGKEYRSYCRQGAGYVGAKYETLLKK